MRDVLIDGATNRTIALWRKADMSKSWRTNMRLYAQEHGTAGAWLSDDRFLQYRLDDNGKVRQTTLSDVRYTVAAHIDPFSL